MLDGHWHFHCPECGMGDYECGYLADDQQLFCEVCLEQEGRLVCLERWLADEEISVYPHSRPGLAA